VLALARATQGRLDEANTLMERALSLGLPASRLLVDRSEHMRCMHGTPVLKRVARESSGLLHGPMLGAVTQTSARVWVRTLAESAVEVRVSAKGDFANPDARASGRTNAAADFTGVVEVGSLKPATNYSYRVLLDGKPVDRGEFQAFRTFPADDTTAPVRIAFGGCAMYHPPHERIWDTIRLRDPDAFMILGDNVYVDVPDSVGPFHDFTYHQRQSRPEFRRLVAGVATFAIWDDHDAGIDDVFLGPYPDKPAWKLEYLELFNRNWNNPPAGAPPQWPGLWHKFRTGPIECFMLDGRYYRENFLKPHASMLGPVQKAWLLKSLKESTAPFKLLVSPVAWADDAKIETGPDGERIYAKDIWSGFREERTEIYDFLAENNITGVILISSDRHRHDVRINERPRGYPLLEVETGWLTNEFGTGGSGEPIWQYLDGPGFGTISVETRDGGPVALLEVISADGEPLFRREVKADELR
jgi:alkaline phosphatase D